MRFQPCNNVIRVRHYILHYNVVDYVWYVLVHVTLWQVSPLSAIGWYSRLNTSRIRVWTSLKLTSTSWGCYRIFFSNPKKVMWTLFFNRCFNYWLLINRNISTRAGQIVLLQYQKNKHSAMKMLNLIWEAHILNLTTEQYIHRFDLVILC